MNHLFIGAIAPLAVFALIYICRGLRAGPLFLVSGPLVTAASMLWAIAPDVPRALGMLELYRKLSFDPGCDIFYWHYSIDLVEKNPDLFAPAVALVPLSFMLMALREIRLMEKQDSSPE